MAEHTGEPEPWDVPISPETMRAAITIAEYLIPHAKMAFGEMQADEELESAKYIWKRILQDERQTLPEQDIWQSCRGRFKKTEPLKAALQILVDREYLTPVYPTTPPGRGRKPAPSYKKNPAAVLGLGGGAA